MRAARSKSSTPAASRISVSTAARICSVSPSRIRRISSIIARYSASDCSPTQGALQRPMWKSRHGRSGPSRGRSYRQERTVCSRLTTSSACRIGPTDVYGPKYRLPSLTTRRVT